MRSSPAKEDIAFAASCAAFFSKARYEGKVPVAKALVSDLSKPAGAAPGKVSQYVECLALQASTCPLSVPASGPAICRRCLTTSAKSELRGPSYAQSA